METQKNNDIVLIEDYLDGKLSETEKEQFLQRLETDAEFAKLYRFRLKIRDDLLKVRQYESIKQEVVGAIKQTKSKQRKTVLYAVAASLVFLVVISGVFSLMNRQPEPASIAETETDSTWIEQMEPQTKEPGIYGDSGTFEPDAVIEEISLSFEKQNDSLVFFWQPALMTETDLVILEQETEKEILRRSLQSESEKMVLHRDELPAGKLVWYLESFQKRDSFEIR
jgi:anti-sigma-K factor RskA